MTLLFPELATSWQLKKHNCHPTVPFQAIHNSECRATVPLQAIYNANHHHKSFSPSNTKFQLSSNSSSPSNISLVTIMNWIRSSSLHTFDVSNVCNFGWIMLGYVMVSLALRCLGYSFGFGCYGSGEREKGWGL